MEEVRAQTSAVYMRVSADGTIRDSLMIVSTP